MDSEQVKHIEQNPINDQQNPNISNCALEDNRNGEEDTDASYKPKQVRFSSADDTVKYFVVEQNPSDAETEESDQELKHNVEQNPSDAETEESEQELKHNVDDADKDAVQNPEHFLSQTNSDSESDEGQDVNNVIGASAETLITLSHVYDTGRKRVMYSCNVCEKDFKDKRVCIRHVRVHTGEKPFTCLDCGESFGREDYLRRHIRSHSDEKPFSCPFCNKDFKRKDYLDEHLLLHNNMSERPFPCNQCEKGYVKRSHLERHLKTHLKNHEFTCTECGKGFHEKRNLLDHFRRLHTKRVKPSCKRCNREFKSEFLLQKHMEVHARKDEESDEELLQSLPKFVRKDKKESQADTQNPSIEESDSHSLFGNVLDVNDTVSQESESTNEELSTLDSQFT